MTEKIVADDLVVLAKDERSTVYGDRDIVSQTPTKTFSRRNHLIVLVINLVFIGESDSIRSK